MITIAMSIAPIAGAKNIACLSAVTGLVISSSMTMPIEHSAIVSRYSILSTCHTRSISIFSSSVPSGNAAAIMSACISTGWLFSAISENALIWNSTITYVSSRSAAAPARRFAAPVRGARASCRLPE